MPVKRIVASTHSISHDGSLVLDRITWSCKSQIANRRGSIAHTQPLSDTILERNTLVLGVTDIHQRLDSTNSGHTNQSSNQRRTHGEEKDKRIKRGKTYKCMREVLALYTQYDGLPMSTALLSTSAGIA
jgi:hypothetical protein